FRQVIEDAILDPDPNAVVFDPAFFGATPRTISLLTPLPVITAAGGPLTVPGPGADLLTIQRDPTAPNFGVIHSQAPEFNLSDVTITGGVAENAIGGGLRFGSFSVNTLDHVVVTGNSATGNALTAGSGGGIGLDGLAFLNMQSTTVSGNTAERNGGGVYFYFNGSLLMENSTISGNATTTAVDSYGGGGLYFTGVPYYYPPSGFTPGALTIRNSTIADNTTAGSGGGLLMAGVSGPLQIESSTISGNAAGSAVNGGGGIAAVDSPYFGNALTLRVVNTIVSGNTNDLAPDILNGFDANYIYSSAVGDLEALQGFTITGGSGNVDVNAFADLMLTPLGDFGGPTETFALMPGSPLIDVGSTGAVTTTTDQRGLDRVFGAEVDIGAVEFQPPRVTVTPGPGQDDPTNNATILFTVTFDSPVTGFDNPATDVVLSGTAGAATAVITPVSGSVYTVAVSGMTSSGTVILTIPADAAVDQVGAGNLASAGGDDTIEFDNTAPTATFEQVGGQPDPTNLEPVQFAVSFSEPVFGFDAADVLNTGTLTGTPTVAVAQTGPTTYSVTFTNLNGEGTIVPGLVIDGVTDAAGNGAVTAAGADSSVTFDDLGPRVTIDQGAGQGDPTNSTSIVFDVVFSEPVTDFTVADVSLTGSTNGGSGLTPVVAGSGTTYTVTVTGMVNGDTVVATVLGGGTTDALGNIGFASTSTDNEVTFDTSSPTVTVNQAAGQADPATAEPILFTAVFSEPVANFTGSDVVLTGAGAAGATATVTQVDPTTWTISVSGMTSTGPVTASLPGANYTDLAGNAGTDSTSTDDTVQFDYGGSFTLDAATYQVDEDGASLVVTVTRTGGNFGDALVSFGTTAGTATAGSDFTTTAGTLTFPAGGALPQTQTFTIPILDDRVIEGDETFTVALTGVTNATAVSRLDTPGTATVTIADIEEGQFDFSAPVYTVAEADGVATTTATITVTRSNGSFGDVSVNYSVLATADGAHAGGPRETGQMDFDEVTAGVINFVAGQTSQTFSVTVNGDDFNEGRERIALTLTGIASGNGIVGPDAASFLVIDADDGVALTAKGVANTDTDGDVATIKLSTGTGEFFRHDPDGNSQGPIDLIRTSGTTDTGSTLAVTVKKPRDSVSPDAGKIGINEITGVGLKAISAKSAYLTGEGIHLTGYLGALTIGDVLNGADLIIGSTTAATNARAKPTNITAGVIGDGTDITVGLTGGTTGKGIGKLTATRIGAGTITAPVIGGITVKGSTKAPATPGDLASSVSVSGAGAAAGKPALGKVSVAGSI
ncbi:MAG TPA: Calx-beta domain-containing protein, partial [Gemmataceae bacterium]|nr:Calx-beta domain-containing protein [Gemmataceae bacterium]